MLSFWIQGFLIGLASLAPVGMQNLFVINTALAQTWRRLLLTCVIVFLFDMSLTVAAYFGMGWVLTTFPLLKILILLVGVAVVVYIGLSILRDRPTMEKVATSIPIKKIIATAAVVSWGNPQAILDTSLMLGAFRASLPEAGVYYFFAGIMTAIPLWFTGLGAVFKIMASKISISGLVWINRICGTFITLYGLKLIGEGLMLLLGIE